jgi:hypothetical protein
MLNEAISFRLCVSVDWGWAKSEIPKGHTIPFIHGLATATEEMAPYETVPRWLVALTERGRQALKK